jgi:dolichol kinase
MATYWERYFDGWEVSIWRVAVFLSAIVCSWCITGYLRLHGYLRPGDARKINHILALSGVALWFGWLPAGMARASAMLTGACILLLVTITCLWHKSPPFSWAFAANTRPSDAPYESLLFWTSWLMSILALLIADLAFMDIQLSRTAALLVGISDGLAEPVGMRWGRHQYQIQWTQRMKPSTRSIEGSLCVALSSLVIILCCYVSSGIPWWPQLIGGALLVALALTLVEAVSPHGWDNFTVPITAALLLHAVIG